MWNRILTGLLDMLKPTNDSTNRIDYQHNFAILSKSYIRDLNRSYNCYESFEKYFLNNEHVPYFIIVPDCDLKSFKLLFTEKHQNRDIAKIPIFMSERQILEASSEPVEAALAMGGVLCATDH